LDRGRLTNKMVQTYELMERLVTQQKAVLELAEQLSLVVGDAELQRGREGGAILLAVANEPRIVVRCLGPFVLRVDGCEVETGRPTRALGLLQYLLVHRSRPVSREVLIEELWPDPEALAARSSLKVALHTLRRFLGGFGGDQMPLTVHVTSLGYQLGTRDVWLDADAFEWHVREATRLEHAGKAEESSVHYTQATRLYRGDFLEGSDADWAILRREALKDQFLFVLARLAEMAFAAEDYRACVLYCQRLLQYDACREDTYRMLLRAHGRLGQRARVQSWYSLCERNLREALDVAPEPVTREVYREALAHTPLRPVATAYRR
jgi:DNA-binding SARP family transcriptional activator